MGLFDRFREGVGVQRPISPAASDDDQAIARYRYMLRTAPPETIEQAHAEAFAKLTPEQRRRVLQELSSELPEGERAAAARVGDDPQQLAQLATRAEIRQPGVMERVFGGAGAAPAAAGPGMGAMFGTSFLASMAGTVLGSMIAQHFFSHNAEAAQLFGDSSDFGREGHPMHDAFNAPTIDDGSSGHDDSVADSGLGDDFSGFDGGSFDV